MKNILVIGAGLSSSSMIKYLLENSEKEGWFVNVGDMNEALAAQKVSNHPRGKAFKFNALDAQERWGELQNVDLVISMLPAHLHLEVVKDCIKLKINTITPSYVSDGMKELDAAAKEAGIILMNEIGVDPEWIICQPKRFWMI